MSRPQHHKAVRLRLIPAALGLGAVVALAGCSAGQVTQTDTQVAAVDGGSGDVKDVALRNVNIPFPTQGSFFAAGSSAPLAMELANEGPDDKLASASSPYAASVTISGDASLPSHTAVQATGGDKTIPPDPAIRQVSITLQGLKQQIGPGVTIPVTFTFEKAGQVTVQVPVGKDTHPRPEHGSPNAGGN